MKQPGAPRKNLQDVEIGPTTPKSKAWYLSLSACIPSLNTTTQTPDISILTYIREKSKKTAKPDSLLGFFPALKLAFSLLATRKMYIPATSTPTINAVATGPSSTGLEAKNRAWRPYVKGTQVRSPKASIKPKPSVVMSIWLRIVCSCTRQSRTYQPSKMRTIHILSVSFPILTYCSQAQEMLSKSQRIMPGRTSLNVLRSKEENPGMVGLRGRPIKNCKAKC